MHIEYRLEHIQNIRLHIYWNTRHMVVMILWNLLLSLMIYWWHVQYVQYVRRTHTHTHTNPVLCISDDYRVVTVYVQWSMNARLRPPPQLPVLPASTGLTCHMWVCVCACVWESIFSFIVTRHFHLIKCEKFIFMFFCIFSEHLTDGDLSSRQPVVLCDRRR